MTITLYPDQQIFYNDIINSLRRVDTVCGVLPTGGGKSVIIGKLASVLPGRTLVLTHRLEILQQNAKWIPNCGTLTAKNENLRYDNKVVFAMVQTLHARIAKHGIKYLGQFENIILDEIQVLIFEKVFSQYNHKRLIGFTGTPIIYKKIYTTIDGVEWVEPYTLSEMFEEMVQGYDVQDLVDIGRLVQDYNVKLTLPNMDKLEDSNTNPDGYTKESLNAVYNNTASLNVLMKAYNNLCKGKKTIIFNATTEVNKFVYKHFKEQGLNAMMFDSVNDAEINPATDKKWTRKEVIQWFKDTEDAILINTNVFTTGFDVDDILCVIVNRATKSLSLWLQMVGRASRVTKKIFKDRFTCIDLGQNIEKHGIWSEARDWLPYFHKQEKKLRNKEDLLSTWDCHDCGAINILGTLKCEFCGAEKGNAVVNGNKKKNKEGELKAIETYPVPSGKKIVDYCESINEDSNFAFKLAERKIMDLFVYHKVSPKFYNERAEEFEERIKNIYRKIYFVIIKSDLPGSRKKLETMYKKVLTKISQKYGN